MVINLGTQPIETERLILRRFERSDVSDMIKNWISIPEVQNNYGEPVYETICQVNDLLDKWVYSYSNNEFYRWAIILKDLGINIGQIAFYKVNSKHHNADVEYCIGKAFWGQGYATEALLEVNRYAFEHMNYNRIQAFHRSKNNPSGRVLEKVGMKYEGTLKQYLLHNGEFDDCIMYAILKEEWETNQ